MMKLSGKTEETVRQEDIKNESRPLQRNDDKIRFQDASQNRNLKQRQLMVYQIKVKTVTEKN